MSNIFCSKWSHLYIAYARFRDSELVRARRPSTPPSASSEPTTDTSPTPCGTSTLVVSGTVTAVALLKQVYDENEKHGSLCPPLPTVLQPAIPTAPLLVTRTVLATVEPSSIAVGAQVVFIALALASAVFVVLRRVPSRPAPVTAPVVERIRNSFRSVVEVHSRFAHDAIRRWKVAYWLLKCLFANLICTLIYHFFDILRVFAHTVRAAVSSDHIQADADLPRGIPPSIAFFLCYKVLEFCDDRRTLSWRLFVRDKVIEWRNKSWAFRFFVFPLLVDGYHGALALNTGFVGVCRALWNTFVIYRLNRMIRFTAFVFRRIHTIRRHTWKLDLMLLTPATKLSCTLLQPYIPGWVAVIATLGACIGTHVVAAAALVFITVEAIYQVYLALFTPRMLVLMQRLEDAYRPALRAMPGRVSF